MNAIIGILGDRAIRDRLTGDGEKLITGIPAEEILVNPASINLRIGNTFLIPVLTGFPLRLGDKTEYKRVEIKEDEYFLLEPGKFALATTKECVNVPTDLAAFVQGRSSIGRVGLQVQNAGFVDPGFHGHITLELKNDSPNTIAIWPGYPVAQIVLITAGGVETAYEGKYNGQVEATGSRMDQDTIARERAEMEGNSGTVDADADSRKV